VEDHGSRENLSLPSEHLVVPVHPARNPCSTPVSKHSVHLHTTPFYLCFFSLARAPPHPHFAAAPATFAPAAEQETQTVSVRALSRRFEPVAEVAAPVAPEQSAQAQAAAGVCPRTKGRGRPSEIGTDMCSEGKMRQVRRGHTLFLCTPCALSPRCCERRSRNVRPVIELSFYQYTHHSTLRQSLRNIQVRAFTDLFYSKYHQTFLALLPPSLWFRSPTHGASRRSRRQRSRRRLLRLPRRLPRRMPPRRAPPSSRTWFAATRRRIESKRREGGGDESRTSDYRGSAFVSHSVPLLSSQLFLTAHPRPSRACAQVAHKVHVQFQLQSGAKIIFQCAGHHSLRRIKEILFERLQKKEVASLPSSFSSFSPRGTEERRPGRFICHCLAPNCALGRTVRGRAPPTR